MNDRELGTVVENEFSKSICLRICPEVANFTRAEEVSRSPLQLPPIAPHAESSHGVQLKALERDYRIYSYLSGALVSTSPSMDCILQCIGASSTDNFPDETIENTLIPHDWVKHRPSYWSSGGHDDPDAPETLTYRLNCDMCIVDEIKLQPFKGPALGQGGQCNRPGPPGVEGTRPYAAAKTGALPQRQNKLEGELRGSDDY
uniref:Uncharacterized protein n=1 Tax=Oryza meridionalis TaxID=40149 RepID=A0A0E0DWJ9_9ORYZ